MSHLRHEIPTKVNQEDTFRLGPIQLGPRQLLYLGLGVIGAASVWTSWPALPAPVRAAGGVICLTVGALVALWRPGGRELLEWLFVLLHYLALPRLARWRPVEPRPADWRPAPGDWAGATTRLRATTPSGGDRHGRHEGEDRESEEGDENDGGAAAPHKEEEWR